MRINSIEGSRTWLWFLSKCSSIPFVWHLRDAYEVLSAFVWYLNASSQFMGSFDVIN